MTILPLLHPRRRLQSGSAVLALILLLGIMLLYLAGNAAALHHLRREMALTERKQERALLERLERLERLEQLKEKAPPVPPPKIPIDGQSVDD